MNHFFLISENNVEHCHCINNAAGTKCDSCETGYHKAVDKITCVKCICNNNAKDCEWKTGISYHEYAKKEHHDKTCFSRIVALW